MSLPWEARRRHPLSGRRKTRGIQDMCREVPPAAPVPQSRRGKCRMRSGRIREDRSASRRHSAGVTGLKPTYGTVSRYGLVAYGSSLDQIGPVAKDTSDCAAVLEMIASHDKKDSTSLERTDTDLLLHLSMMSGECGSESRRIILGKAWMKKCAAPSGKQQMC